jgi:hypothetical protein
MPPRYPNRNVASLIQRANDLVHACRRDKQELLAAGMDWQFVERAARLIPLLAQTEAECKLDREVRWTDTANLNSFVKECRKLRTRIATDLRTAAAAHSIPLRVPPLSNKCCRSELVQALADLSFIINSFKTELQQAHFDVSLAALVGDTATKLSLQMADIVLDREAPLPRLEKRNTYFHELRTLLISICTFGRKSFPSDTRLRRAYRTIF